MLENLLSVAIKALGIDPDILMEHMRRFMEYVYGKLAEFDERMLAQEKLIAGMSHQVTRIEALLLDMQLRDNSLIIDGVDATIIPVAPTEVQVTDVRQ
jgi:uncharacterized coiled-coil protein SlyX